jgi:transcriptional regulator with XRE-family HTH domain
LPEHAVQFRAMQSVSQPLSPSAISHAGRMLREWRVARRFSQLDLALEAKVSARHLSFVETGKAQPSREMVTRLADALGMPLREHNALLIAAGYAPVHRETPLTTPEMAAVRRAIEFILEHQEPYPALVTNRHWDVLMANRALTRVFDLLCNRGPLHTNVMHQVFDPNDMRSVLANWEEVAGDLIRHLHDAILSSPSDTKTRALLSEVLAYPNIPDRWRTREAGAIASPLLTVVFRSHRHELRFFSTIATFGTPHDVTLEELRIECMFPADDATAELCRSLAQ